MGLRYPETVAVLSHDGKFDTENRTELQMTRTRMQREIRRLFRTEVRAALETWQVAPGATGHVRRRAKPGVEG